MGVVYRPAEAPAARPCSARRTMASAKPGSIGRCRKSNRYDEPLGERVEDLVAVGEDAVERGGGDLRETVLAFVRERGSIARTAARLYTHRSTVVRRLARARSEE